MTLLAASVWRTWRTNIIEIDGEHLYRLESLHLDLHEGAGGCGSSCGDEWGGGWAPAAGETHELACGC